MYIHYYAANFLIAPQGGNQGLSEVFVVTGIDTILSQHSLVSQVTPPPTPHGQGMVFH